MPSGPAQCKQKGLVYSQAGFAPIFILVIFLVVAAVATEVYFLARKNFSPVKREASVISTQNSKEKDLAVQKEQSTSLIADVKAQVLKQPEILEYSNSELGFIFKYSKDLSVKPDSEEEFDKRGNGKYRKNFTGYVGYEPGKPLGAVVVLGKDQSFDINPFSVWVFDNPDNLSLDGWFDKYWYYPFLWGVFDYTSKGHVRLDTEATVSGQIAKYKVVSYQNGKPTYVYLSKNNKMYLLRVVGGNGEKILSSFKLN